jgi:hypothetical protein
MEKLLVSFDIVDDYVMVIVKVYTGYVSQARTNRD